MLLTLNKITLDAPLDRTGECLVLTELILPRNGIARKAALKDLRLTKGKRSLARESFYERALLKEKVDGPFGLKVSVTRPLKHPELAKFMRQLLAAGAEGLGDAAGLSAFPNLSLSVFAKGLRDLVKVPFDETADSLESDDLAFIASGGLDLDSDSLISGEISVPLKLTETIRSSANLKLSEKREQRKPAAKIYKKGSVVGEVSFDVLVD